MTSQGGLANFKERLIPYRNVVEDYMPHAVSVSPQETLRKAMEHLPLAGGKRLRPVLAMLACEAVGGDPRKAVPFGAALELIHNFTLVHDDIMDNDSLRRGVPTVHAVYGAATSINAGDALFARAFEVLGESEVDPALLSGLFRATGLLVREIGEGQQDDMDFETRDNVTKEEYIEMIRKKTAIIYEIAAWGGALIGGASQEEAEALGRYALSIGLGFQIWDDVLDVIGNEAAIGKPVMSDIINNKKTYLVLEALERASAMHRMTLVNTLGNRDASVEELEEVRKVLEISGALKATMDRANELAQKAKGILTRFPESPSRSILFDLVDYMVSRQT